MTSVGSRSGVNWMRLKRAAAGAREAARQHRLADAGHVLDQQVAAAHQRHHGKLHLGTLADDDAFYVIDEALGDRPGIQTGRLSSGALDLTSKRQKGRFGSAFSRLPLRVPASPKAWQ